VIPRGEVLATLRELGIGLVAYSPLGRGFLTGQIRSLADLPEHDWRRSHPGSRRTRCKTTCSSPTA
jgi:aryl-alcohol dehydrogenase-like predicted oxidoreductase